MSANTIERSYEVVIKSPVTAIWQAITDGTLTQKYFFHTQVRSDWAAGSAITYYNEDGSLSSQGVILAIEPQRLLQATFEPLWLEEKKEPSVVNWEIQSLGETTLLTLTQSKIDSATFEEMHTGWVFVVSSLKSLLETGEALPVPAMFG